MPKGTESEENTMAGTTWKTVIEKIQKAKKDSSNSTWSQNFKELLDECEKFAKLFDVSWLSSNLMKREDEESLMRPLEDIIINYKVDMLNKSKDIHLNTPDYNFFQEKVEEFKDNLNSVLSANKNNNKFQDRYAYGSAEILHKIKSFSEYLKETATTNDIIRYQTEASNILSSITGKEEIAVNADTNVIDTLKSMNKTLSSVINMPDVSLEAKYDISQKCCDVMRVYNRYALYNKQQRNNVVIDQAFEELSSALNGFSTANNTIISQLSGNDKKKAELAEQMHQLQSSFSSELTNLIASSEAQKKNTIDEGMQIANEELGNKRLKAHNEKVAEQLRDFEKEQANKRAVQAQEFEDVKNKGKGKAKEEPVPKKEPEVRTQQQATIARLKMEMPEQYAKIPFYDTVYNMLGVTEEDLDKAGYNRDVEFIPDGKTKPEKHNLKELYLQLQRDAVNVLKETASRFRESETGVTPFMNKDELEAVNKEYQAFCGTFMLLYEGGVDNADPSKNVIDNREKSYDLAFTAFEPILKTMMSTQQAAEYIDNYAIRGVQSKKKLFSMYEMMGMMNPDADKNFLKYVGDTNAATRKYLGTKEAQNLKEKFQQGFIEALEDGLKSIDNLEKKLPQYFKDNGKVFGKKDMDKQQILPFVDQKQVNELFKLYQDAYVAVNPFIMDCEKKLNGERATLFTKHKFRNPEEFDLYCAIEPIHKKLKKKAELLGFLEKSLSNMAQKDQLGADIENYNRFVEENKDKPNFEELFKAKYSDEEQRERVEFLTYAASCLDMLKAGTLLPQYLIEDEKNQRVGDILSMHKKKKDIDYANKFEEALYNKKWKDGKRDLSDINTEYKLHTAQLGTDDKMVQYATKNDYKQFYEVIKATADSFFGPTITKNFVKCVIRAKKGGWDGNIEDLKTDPKSIKVGDKEIDTKARLVDYFDKLRKEGIENPKSFSGAFTEEELANEDVKKFVDKLDNTFVIHPEYEDFHKFEYLEKKIDDKETLKTSTFDIYCNILNHAERYDPGYDGPGTKLQLEAYDNEVGYDSFFTEKEMQHDEIIKFSKAVKRNLENAGFGKTAKIEAADVPDGYNEGYALNAAYDIAPTLYPKVTVYDDMTLPHYLGQAMPKNVSHVKIARVEKNFTRTTQIDLKNVTYSPMHTTINDFRRSDFAGDIPVKKTATNFKPFEGKSREEIERELEKQPDEWLERKIRDIIDEKEQQADAKNGNEKKPEFAPNTSEMRDYNTFDRASVIKAAADLQVMDYLLGIPSRGVGDIRIDFAPVFKDGKFIPTVTGISAADNGKKPFTISQKDELTKLTQPKDMLVISEAMSEKILKWSEGDMKGMDDAFKNLPEQCKIDFQRRAKNVAKELVIAKNAMWNDPIDPKTGELRMFGTLETRPGAIRVLSDEQFRHVSMDDLAVGRNQAKNIKEKNEASQNIFDTLAKMPAECNEALIDKAIYTFDNKDDNIDRQTKKKLDFEKRGVYSGGQKYSWFGERGDKKTRDMLTRRFNKFETERLFIQSRKLEVDADIMDENRQHESTWHKITGSSVKYQKALFAIYDIGQTIADERNYAVEEERYRKDPSAYTTKNPEKAKMIREEMSKRNAKRKALIESKGLTYRDGPTPPVSEDPMIYYKVHEKYVEACKKIETYLTSREGANSKLGKERLEGFVKIYNKLNQQIDEYAHLTGDTSYVPKRAILDPDKYTVSFENSYASRYEFEMALPDTSNREFKERENSLNATDEKFLGLKAELKEEREKYQEKLNNSKRSYGEAVKTKTDKIDAEGNSVYETEHMTLKERPTLDTEHFEKTGKRRVIVKDVEVQKTKDDFKAINQVIDDMNISEKQKKIRKVGNNYDFAVVDDELAYKLKKDEITEHNKLVDEAEKRPEAEKLEEDANKKKSKKDKPSEKNANKDANAKQNKKADAPKKKTGVKKPERLKDGRLNKYVEMPKVDTEIYEGDKFINFTNKDTKKMLTAYPKPNSKKARNASAPTFSNTDKIKAERIKKANERAEDKKTGEEMKRKKKVVGKGF